MPQAFFNYATLIGTVLSVVGVVVAVIQIRKTRSAAESASAASAEAKRLVSRDLLLTDVTACTTSIEEVKTLVRLGRHEAALLRVTDLNSLLIRLSHVAPEANASTPDLASTITQLAILRELLEAVNHKVTEDFDPVRVNGVLSKIADQLNHWVAVARFTTDSRVN